MGEEDLERLYARLERPLYNVAFRWVWKAEDAHEIVQEAFLRVWRMRQRVDVETVDALIYKIAINLASSRRRSARLWRWVSLDVVRHEATTERSMDESMSAHEDHVRVRTAVETLPEDLRRVIMLCEYSDLSYEQVAHVLSIPPGTVGSKRHRAVRLLRQHLRREGDT